MAIEKWRIKLVYIHPFIQLFTLPTVSCRIQNHYDRFQLCNELKIVWKSYVKNRLSSITYNLWVYTLPQRFQLPDQLPVQIIMIPWGSNPGVYRKNQTKMSVKKLLGT